MAFLIDFVLHVDRHLSDFVLAYGAWVYALLFIIIFVETGLVVMPFLRTFAPFVAGVAEITRSTFTAYNVGGAVLWVCGLTLAGYLFGYLASSGPAAIR